MSESTETKAGASAKVAKNQSNAGGGIWLQVVLVLGILVFVNLMLDSFYVRLDLTKEKRYSLSEVSANTLDSLPGIVTVRVYLDGGDLSADVKRFRDAVRTQLEEMKVIADGNLEFQFLDPSNNMELQKYLNDQGIYPIRNQEVKSNTQVQEQLIYPVAIVSLGTKQEVIDLLKGDYEGNNGNPNFSAAETQLEYKFIASFRRLMAEEKKIIAFLTGHGEIRPELMPEWMNELAKSYRILEVNCKNGFELPSPKSHLPKNMQNKVAGEGIEVLVIAQPDSTFTAREIYEIDQYLMRGGKILWLVDQEAVDVQMLQSQGITLTRLRELGLDEYFLHNGFKIKYDLIQDVVCDPVFLTAQKGPQKGDIKPYPWLYFPSIVQYEPHEVNRNLDRVMLRYASSIDTVPNSYHFTKPIIKTSEFSRTVNGTLTISFQELLNEPPPINLFVNKGFRMVGISQEGNFVSFFADKDAPLDKFAPEKPKAAFITKTPFPTKQIILSDGDLPLQMQLGRDRFIPRDNLQFLLNCVDYLSGDIALTQVRAKDIQDRPLDKVIVQDNRGRLQFFNLLAPLLLLAAFGALRFYLRRRQNARLRSV